jgi:hypothetical protein
MSKTVMVVEEGEQRRILKELGFTKYNPKQVSINNEIKF